MLTKKIPATSAGTKLQNKEKPAVRELLTAGVARLEGLEPPTYWFVASHSIQLSYKRIFDCRNIIPHSRIKCKSPLGKISIPS